MNKAQSGWTEERLAKLRELWDKKLSITKIGEELGVSRNAVAGKAHRLGLEKRQSPIKPSIKQKTQKNHNRHKMYPVIAGILFTSRSLPARHPIKRLDPSLGA